MSALAQLDAAFLLSAAARPVTSETPAALEIDDLHVEYGNVVNAGSRDVVIHDDVTGQASIRTRGSLRIHGNVRGESRRACRLEAGGELIVDGDVAGASAAARSMRVGGAVSDALLSAAGDVWLGAGAAKTRIVSTFFEESKRQLDGLRQRIAQAVELRDSLARQIQQQQKRLDRFSRSLRSHVDLRVGQVIRHSADGIRVDLAPVYAALGSGLPVARVDQAVARLFIKGVVGVLTKRNRDYLRGNPAREQTFAQVLAQLRLLFESVRTHDKVLDGLRAAEDESAALVDGLVAPHDGLRVINRGILQSGCEIRLQPTSVKALRGGNAQLHKDGVTVRIGGGPRTDARVLLPLRPVIEAPETGPAVLETRGREFVIADIRVEQEEVAP